MSKHEILANYNLRRGNGSIWWICFLFSREDPTVARTEGGDQRVPPNVFPAVTLPTRTSDNPSLNGGSKNGGRRSKSASQCFPCSNSTPSHVQGPETRVQARTPRQKPGRSLEGR
ncbi:hypothetical protein J6590_004268 [Homalodisca vitripennis]|nr:hypothetical protein J6590_004268 [Homalodisca vitripennis]